METKLECTNGYVKIQRIVDEENNESVKLTTNIEDEGEMALTLSYDCAIKADTSFKNLSKANPDELKVGVVQMLGL
jgi:hypothetical protein